MGGQRAECTRNPSCFLPSSVMQVVVCDVPLCPPLTHEQTQAIADGGGRHGPGGPARNALELSDISEDGGGASGSRKDPLDALRGLHGMDFLRTRLESIGQRILVRQREGRGTAGIIGNMVFTGARSSCLC